MRHLPAKTPDLFVDGSLLNTNQKKLLTLLSDGTFHSGEELADILKISRSSVWKHLHLLEELSIKVISVSGKGYRLDRTLELFDHKKITANLSPTSKGLLTKLEIFDQIASTNTYLLNQNANIHASGMVCLAEQQTAGKGRRGRTWISPFGSNIYLSILWLFQSGPMEIAGLSLAIGVAVVRALRQLYAIEFSLKWPNDIYFESKKLGGILVEVSGEAGGPCKAVIGLGLNLNMPSKDGDLIDQAWIDLAQITGKDILEKNQLTALLLNNIFTLIQEFENHGLAVILDEWRRYDCLVNKQVTLFVGTKQINGIVKGINDNGLIVISAPDGSTQAYASGEISFNG
jgi:BirA family biotin operon repressor/biotin-[acetyl-CoA-carboxylase] ligase